MKKIVCIHIATIQNHLHDENLQQIHYLKCQVLSKLFENVNVTERIALNYHLILKIVQIGQHYGHDISNKTFPIIEF